jgi:hypothetical protein
LIAIGTIIPTMYQLLFLGLVCSCVLSFVAAICHDDSQVLWTNFKTTYNKVYNDTQSEKDHYRAFLVTLINIDKRNSDEISNGGQAIHGITQFADMIQNDFENQILAKQLGSGIAGTPYQLPDQSIIQSLNMSSRLVDWTGKYTTPVKDQVSEACVCCM